MKYDKNIINFTDKNSDCLVHDSASLEITPRNKNFHHYSTFTLLSTTLIMVSNIFKIGVTITSRTGLCFNSQIKTLKHYFGMSPHACAVITDRIKKNYVFVSRVCLLWSLCFFCCYPKDKVKHKVFEVDVKI